MTDESGIHLFIPHISRIPRLEGRQEGKRRLRYDHRRTARGAHGLPNVSLWLALPYPYGHFGGWPLAVFFPFAHHTPYTYGYDRERLCAPVGDALGGK
jgi:hypothetical protein